MPVVNLRRLAESSENLQVMSLNVQANAIRVERPRSQFEILVRHLFDRMLNNEAFGEEAASRMTQLACAIALPGILVAMFLFASYHPPRPLARDFWSQAADHMFYVTYAFVIMGMAIVFQWEMLFPDLLDVYVLTSMPIPRMRLLLGRLAALGIFLGLVQLETSGPGAIFFPGVADLKCGFFRHVATHVIAVSMAALFAVTFFLALQSLLVCLPSRVAGRVSGFIKVLSIVLLLTVLFLFPLVAHSIEQTLALPSWVVHWCPPFWFLGVYQTLLYGSAAPPIFHQLATTGLRVTVILSVFGALLYPIAYTRRVRQLVEGTGMRQGRSIFGPAPSRIVHAFVVRTPRARAIFYFAAQTLLRLQRLHLYLAMYAGAGLAIVLSGLAVFVADKSGIRLALSPDGIRIAIPVLAFWTVMGLRTALLSPLGRQGSWIFRVIGGKPSEEELRAAETLVRGIAIAVTSVAVAMLHVYSPTAMRVPLVAIGQLVVALGLSILLTDLAFLRTRSIPFTTAKIRSSRELPITLVQYFVVFPWFALTVVEKEAWIEASWTHLLETVVLFTVFHLGVLWLRKQILRGQEPVDESEFLGLGLREQE